ncbi:uncharacterized protein LOC129610765 [Condylostylus longicornis]|uniref:uncharacterized protein LOC129610765 n=1 Tax=Condylostylus longicornis TaxID=2530218 RepID=UPI00244DB50B|nr:uncharacterized protein LOC129610765 [Condylostylus longicornis]
MIISKGAQLLFTILLTFIRVSKSNENIIDSIIGSQIFAKKFYSELITQPKYNGKSLVYSPLSIEIAGALLYVGADGKTASEILNGFNFKLKDPKQLGQYFHEAVKKLNLEDKILNIANKIYIQNDYTISHNYKDTAVRSFHSDIENINFGRSNEAANTINNWVCDKTNEKIKNLIEPDSLNSSTKFMLLNTIHFKGIWKELFNVNHTKKREFYVTPDEIIEVDTMHILSNFNVTFINDIGLKAIDIPFKNSNLSIFLVSSAYKNESLNILENKLNSIDLKKDLFDTTRNIKISLYIPKFQIETAIDMESTFKNLGMTEMFSSEASFKNLLANYNEKLILSKAVHKAIIEVNEEGAEASAGTAHGFIKKSGPLNFHVNQSFMYFIKSSDGQIYFMGRFTGIFMLNLIANINPESYYSFVPSTRYVDFLKENQNFTVNFYSQLIRPQSNRGKSLVFSPYSIQSAGAALYAGTDGDTAEEIEEGLHFPTHDTNVLGDIYKRFVDIMQKSPMFKGGTKIYVQKNYSIAPTFQDIITRFYSAEIESIEFNENSLIAANSINDWVARKTEGKIQNLVKTGDLNELTRLLLLNVVHFKGEWLKKFDKDKTKKEDFVSEPGEIIKLDMMHGLIEFKSANHKELNIKVAELYFQETDISLIILLPSSSEISLKQIEDKLTRLLLKDLVFNKTGRKETRHIIMPKFKIESEIDMEQVFKNMGMDDMFTSDANFSLLLNSTDPIQLSKVFHKSILDVDENGIESAAPTNTDIDAKEFEDEPFKVNQSFLYFIRGKFGEIYFMGRFTGK